jgi:hypothetical protein
MTRRLGAYQLTERRFQALAAADCRQRPGGEYAAAGHHRDVIA